MMQCSKWKSEVNLWGGVRYLLSFTLLKQALWMLKQSLTERGSVKGKQFAIP